MMRAFVITLCVLVVAIVAAAVYLVATTPKDAPPLRAPLTASQQALIARVPADAEGYALISAPAVLLRKLEANPVTQEPILQWTSAHALPPKVMLGPSDAVI
jgi:hypothetical protein